MPAISAVVTVPVEERNGLFESFPESGHPMIHVVEERDDVNMPFKFVPNDCYYKRTTFRSGGYFSGTGQIQNQYPDRTNSRRFVSDFVLIESTTYATDQQRSRSCQAR